MKVRPCVLTQGALGAFILYFVGWADYVSGYQLNFSIFYFIPVAIWAWYLGWGPAVIMAGVCAGGWFANDILDGNSYPHAYYRFWNGGMQLVTFLTVAVGVHLLQRRLQREKELSARIQTALQELEDSMAEVRTLRQQALTVCSVTRRIQVGAEWIDLDRFLRDKLQLPIRQVISDQALSAIVEKMIEYHELHEAA